MKERRLSIFRRITILVFSLITALCLLFMGITYFATTHFFQASTQLLNKDVAAHIAEFTSPFDNNGLNKQKADSVFKNAMVISPSAEIYFLDTTGKVIDFHAKKSDIKLWNISLDHIKTLIASKGKDYIKGTDPKDPDNQKIFSAAEVWSGSRKLGYIYVILGSNEYRNVTALLFNSHISYLVGEAFFVIIVLSIIISFIYLNRIQQSFNRMILVLDKFQQGDFNARFQLKDQHELAPITQAFNRMADLLVYNIDRLTKSERERKDFIATISHDLRTPLSIARGYTETILINKEKNEINGSEQTQYVQLILNKILQVESMVKQLFELSKMESVEFKPEKEPFVISEIVREAVNTFQLAALEKHITLKCTQCLYHVWIEADIAMMERVVQNLIDNAIKSTPENGDIGVSIVVENKELVFTIINTGKPLPEDLLEWINNSDTENKIVNKRPKNLGLGLAIVKKIVDLHHFTFKAETGVGSGNSFSIRMPKYR